MRRCGSGSPAGFWLRWRPTKGGALSHLSWINDVGGHGARVAGEQLAFLSDWRGNAREAAVAKIAVLIWIVMGITIAGVFGTVILATPALSNEAAELLPWAALAGFVVAIPASVVIARKILAVSGNR